MPVKHIEGKWGRLTVLESFVDRGRMRARCVCECGTEKTVAAADLRTGSTKSCGCYSDEELVSRSYRHGHAVGGKVSPEYATWRGMISRCTNEHHKSFTRYGGRGISVCDRWMHFPNFLSDMGKRPDGYSLDRIDNNRGYSKSNCIWASMGNQSRNRRNTKPVIVGGKKFSCMKDAAKATGLSYYQFIRRKKSGKLAAIDAAVEERKP